jgi:hypothetical protein
MHFADIKRMHDDCPACMRNCALTDTGGIVENTRAHFVLLKHDAEGIFFKNVDTEIRGVTDARRPDRIQKTEGEREAYRS